jgi:hypothetical protein
LRSIGARRPSRNVCYLIASPISLLKLPQVPLLSFSFLPGSFFLSFFSPSLCFSLVSLSFSLFLSIFLFLSYFFWVCWLIAVFSPLARVESAKAQSRLELLQERLQSLQTANDNKGTKESLFFCTVSSLFLWFLVLSYLSFSFLFLSFSVLWLALFLFSSFSLSHSLYL